jgi:hypothetical protein
LTFKIRIAELVSTTLIFNLLRLRHDEVVGIVTKEARRHFVHRLPYAHREADDRHELRLGQKARPTVPERAGSHSGAEVREFHAQQVIFRCRFLHLSNKAYFFW